MYFYIIWISDLSALSVPDEGYSRNASCALNLIFTFLFIYTLEKTRKVSQEWTIQRHWQHWAQKTQDEDKQNK
jgi:hypothetical protein